MAFGGKSSQTIVTIAKSARLLPGRPSRFRPGRLRSTCPGVGFSGRWRAVPLSSPCPAGWPRSSRSRRGRRRGRLIPTCCRSVRTTMWWVNERLTPAVGEVAWLSGRWLTEAGSPIRHATIEIWPRDSTAAIAIRRPAPTRRSGTRMVTALAGPWFFAPPRGGSAGFLRAGLRERTPRGRRGSVDGGAGWTGGRPGLAAGAASKPPLHPSTSGTLVNDAKR